jgi:hypothetical protein
VLKKLIQFKTALYHHNGTWWGYHQSKIVSIGDTEFTYYTDNSTQQGQVANLNNPNKAVFLIQTANGMRNSGEVIPHAPVMSLQTKRGILSTML